MSMTLRTVIKSSYFGTQIVVPNMHHSIAAKPKDHSIDNYIRSGCNENRDDNVQCIYIEPKHSLIGYCTIKMKDIEAGVNNSLRVELLTRSTAKVVGYANLEIYVFREPTLTLKDKLKHANDEPILFVDPGCSTTEQPSTV